MATTVKLNMRGIREVLKGPEVTADLARRSKRVEAAAGDGFEAVVKPGKYTARAYVQSAGRKGDEREASEKALTRALDAAR